jgi:hypothetical protein
MKIDNVGQMIFAESDVFDLIMSGRELNDRMLVDRTVDLTLIADIVDDLPKFAKYCELTQTPAEFDAEYQRCWLMPEKYQTLDIAEYILGLCNSPEELQRCGEELLLFQERNLFTLLCYLTYLVDLMRENNIIWGVGRGSSVASYVLYKLGIHKINSLYYDLDPKEFLR